MSRFWKLLSAVVGIGRSWIFSFLLWTVWLALAILLVVQLYVLSANELSIPEFALRRLESRLAASGLRATFSRTSFDPTGNVLIENVRISIPAFAEPVVTARGVFVRLNPWSLVVGRIDPREVRLIDLNAAIPAILSPSSRPEEIIHHLDATIEPIRRGVIFQQASARVAGVSISARGTLSLAPGVRDKPLSDTLADFIANRFASLCRQAIALSDQIAQFEAPALHLEFAPSESGAPTIHVLALARAVRLATPVAVEAKHVRASTKLLLFGDAPPWDIEISARELGLPGTVSAHGVQARVLGRIRMDGSQLDLRELAVTADTVSAAGVDASALSAQVYPRNLPRFDTDAVARILGAPLSLRAAVDLETHQARVRFDGAISPRALDVVSQRVGADVRKYFEFESLAADHGDARFGGGWKFEKLNVRVRIPRMNARGVILEEGRATLELDPVRFYAPEAFARVGDNFARGSYEHDLRDHRYRFLLEGRLQPLEISPWFRPWWSNFFKQLEFPLAPPDASVDVRGSWRDVRQSNVFVFADVAKPVIRGTALDRVRTRIFIRPAFFDGLEILATRHEGRAHGRFTYIGNPETHAWHTLDLGIDSTLDLKVAAQLLGPAGGKALALFRLAAPPSLKVRGQFAGPSAPGGADQKLRIEARTAGEFHFSEFPLQDVSFVAALDRDEVVLDDVKAAFAGGVATGHARVWGRGEDRRLRFDFALDDANLGQLAAGVADFLAAQKGGTANPPGKFVQEKANVRINFATSAEGRYADALSYRGDGSAVLRGAEIGEVPLLGALSELLKFTALRFTEARANFKIEGPEPLVFPAVTLRGSNSAIDAHGAYALDRRELDFNAKIFPFHESGGLIKSVVGAVLTPLSNVFEVKLTGSLVKPQWAFVIGPTNFLRSLATGGEPAGNPVGPVEPHTR